MRKPILLTSIALAPAAVASHAAAQQAIDFATCGPDLVQCDDELVTGCCYRDLSPEQPTDPLPIVIPMDRCHQRLATSGTLGPPPDDPPAWCQDPVGSADEGMYLAYGLVYRLQQHEINLYWTINPTKDPLALKATENYADQTWTERDIDMWILDGGTAAPPQAGQRLQDCGAAAGCAEPPVRRLDATTLAPVAGSYTAREFPLRGGAFVIPADQRDRFDDFWRKRGEFAHLAGNPYYEFEGVDLYEVSRTARFVYQDYRAPGPDYPLFQGGDAAPIAMRLDFKPPRLARQSPAGVSEIWLDKANLLHSAAYPECLTGHYDPPDAVYCDVTMEDIQAGYLTEGDFRWTWIDNWSDKKPCSTDALTAQHQKINEYMTAQPGVRVGGHAVFIHSAVRVVETCEGYELAGRRGVGIDYIRQTPVDPFIMRRPHNLLMQIGDLPLEFASGEVAKWSYASGEADGYDPVHLGDDGTLVRLLSEDHQATGNGLCENHVSTESCDVFETSTGADHVDVAAYFRHESEPLNGVGFYLGGRQIHNRPVQLRMLLNAFISLPGQRDPGDPGPAMEVARSSPIVALVDEVEAQFQGTYLTHDPPKQVTTYRGTVDDDRFQFPYRLGHFRAIPSDQFSETGRAFDEFDPLFEAEDGIPAPAYDGCQLPFSGSCRTVFTNLSSGKRPERVFFDRGSAEVLRPALAPELSLAENETLISRVLAGYRDGGGGYTPKLGAVDRSTAAVIEPSPIVGGDRPTIAYVGAYDGMLHAICADTVEPCDFRGEVLWSYIPRTQLPFLKENRQRIDGSPRVADVFGDFRGNGLREWRTVLTLASGAGRPGFAGHEPAVIALDITDPADPRILWEVTSTEPEEVWGGGERGAVALGEGVGTAMGRVRIDGELRNGTFLQTNNGGTGRPGFFLAAVDTVSGELLWTQHHIYGDARDGNNPPVPRSAIPGGVAAIDREDSGAITDLVVPSLYGDLWLVDAASGANRLTGADEPLADSPLLRFQDDYHPIGPPPTIYKDRASGFLHAVAVSGGYVDPISTSWSPPGLDQFAVIVNLETATGTVDEDTAEAKINIGPNRAFAQAVVAGNELFVVTDSSDANATGYGTSGTATGRLSRYSLGGGGDDVGAQLGEGRELRGGAGSIAVTEDGIVYSGSGDGAENNDFSADHDSEGEGVEVEFTAKDSRILWARTQ